MRLSIAVAALSVAGIPADSLGHSKTADKGEAEEAANAAGGQHTLAHLPLKQRAIHVLAILESLVEQEDKKGKSKREQVQQGQGEGRHAAALASLQDCPLIPVVDSPDLAVAAAVYLPSHVGSERKGVKKADTKRGQSSSSSRLSDKSMEARSKKAAAPGPAILAASTVQMVDMSALEAVGNVLVRAQALRMMERLGVTALNPASIFHSTIIPQLQKWTAEVQQQEQRQGGLAQTAQQQNQEEQRQGGLTQTVQQQNQEEQQQAGYNKGSIYTFEVG